MVKLRNFRIEIPNLNIYIEEKDIVIVSEKNLECLSNAAINGGRVKSNSIVNHHVSLKFNHTNLEAVLNPVIKRYNLSDEEWEYLGGYVGGMIEDGLIPQEIASFLAKYVDGKTPEGRARLYNYFKNIYFNTFKEKDAEKKAKKMAEEYCEKTIIKVTSPPHIKAEDFVKKCCKEDFIPFFD